MKVIADVPDDYFENPQYIDHFDEFSYKLQEALCNGIRLPKDHGRIIDESQICSVTIRTDLEVNSKYQLLQDRIIGTDAPTILSADKGV